MSSWKYLFYYFIIKFKRLLRFGKLLSWWEQWSNVHEPLKYRTYLGTKLFFNFLGADFLVAKGGHRREKQPVLGPAYYGYWMLAWVKGYPFHVIYLYYGCSIDRLYSDFLTALSHSPWSIIACFMTNSLS